MSSVPDTTLTGVAVGDSASVKIAHPQFVVVDWGWPAVGPFTYLRPGTALGADGKLGAFVGQNTIRHRHRCRT